LLYSEKLVIASEKLVIASEKLVIASEKLVIANEVKQSSGKLQKDCFTSFAMTAFVAFSKA
jgi:hypothetical protein